MRNYDYYLYHYTIKYDMSYYIQPQMNKVRIGVSGHLSYF